MDNNPAEFKPFEVDDAEDDISILSVDQATKLLAAADHSIIPFIAIALFAGLRRAEIERLNWREMDLEKKWIRVRVSSSKTASNRFVTIQHNLLEWLQPHERAEGSLLPASTRRTTGKPSSQRLRKLLEKAIKDAGISPWEPNCMRHSFGSYFMSLTNDPKKTAAQMGHDDSQTTFDFYREAVHQNEAIKYFAIRP